MFDALHKWLGIPPAEQPPNHYRLLGIALFESDPDVIDNAADARMALLRSMATGQHAEESQRLLNEVAAAKLCLLKPERKAVYDAGLPNAQPPEAPPVLVEGEQPEFVASRDLRAGELIALEINPARHKPGAPLWLMVGGPILGIAAFAFAVARLAGDSEQSQPAPAPVRSVAVQPIERPKPAEKMATPAPVETPPPVRQVPQPVAPVVVVEQPVVVEAPKVVAGYPPEKLAAFKSRLDTLETITIPRLRKMRADDIAEGRSSFSADNELREAKTMVDFLRSALAAR